MFARTRSANHARDGLASQADLVVVVEPRGADRTIAHLPRADRETVVVSVVAVVGVEPTGFVGGSRTCYIQSFSLVLSR